MSPVRYQGIRRRRTPIHRGEYARHTGACFQGAAKSMDRVHMKRALSTRSLSDLRKVSASDFLECRKTY